MPKLIIGRLYTGKREVHVDSRSGSFNESLPLIEGTALRLQAALIERKAPAASGFDLNLVPPKYWKPARHYDELPGGMNGPLVSVEELDEVCA